MKTRKPYMIKYLGGSRVCQKIRATHVYFPEKNSSILNNKVTKTMSNYACIVFIQSPSASLVLSEVIIWNANFVNHIIQIRRSSKYNTIIKPLNPPDKNVHILFSYKGTHKTSQTIQPNNFQIFFKERNNC